MPAVGMVAAVAWTIGVIPTSKSSAGHPLPVVGSPCRWNHWLLTRRRGGAGGWGGSAVKKGRRDAQIVGQGERDEGVKRGGGSIYRVSLRGPAPPIAWPTRPCPPLLFSFFSSRPLSSGKRSLRKSLSTPGPVGSSGAA